MKLFLLLLSIKCIESKISINIEANSTPKLTVTGVNRKTASNSDIKMFFKDFDSLNQAVTSHYGKKPTNVYYKAPTPWGDLYKTQKWEQITCITKFERYKVKTTNRQPTVIFTQDFENKLNNTIKVNTGISHTVENTLTTSWSKSKEFEISQDVEYDLNIYLAKISGTTGFSYTSIWGKSEERAETVTVGSTSAVETELKPGQSVTAILSVNAGILEVEVYYSTSLRGNLAVNFKKSHRGHHFWGPSIRNVMNSAGIENNVVFVETIKIGYNIDAKLQVLDKSTGKPL